MSAQRTTFRERVYAVVARIPRGSVMTYGEVARRAGNPKAARAVGTAMRLNETPTTIPCHRVVQSSGRVGEYAFGGTKKKIERLKQEGVKFDGRDRVLK